MSRELGLPEPRKVLPSLQYGSRYCNNQSLLIEWSWGKPTDQTDTKRYQHEGDDNFLYVRQEEPQNPKGWLDGINRVQMNSLPWKSAMTRFENQSEGPWDYLMCEVRGNQGKTKEQNPFLQLSYHAKKAWFDNMAWVYTPFQNRNKHAVPNKRPTPINALPWATIKISTLGPKSYHYDTLYNEGDNMSTVMHSPLGRIQRNPGIHLMKGHAPWI